MNNVVCRFYVPGPLVTQGSMVAVKTKSKGKTKTVVIHSKKPRKDGSMPLTVVQWRNSAQVYAKQAMGRRGLYDGPVAVYVVFRVPKANKPMKGAEHFPATKPDLDKLQRALGDALEGTVVTQDSRIADWHAAKRYARLAWPDGAYVEVNEMNSAWEDWTLQIFGSPGDWAKNGGE